MMSHIKKASSFWEECKIRTCNAILVDATDNVAVVTERIGNGDSVQYLLDGALYTTASLEAIPLYHKIAIRNILAGSNILKYGEVIAVAAEDIPAGACVHVHNVKSLRGMNVEERGRGT